MNLKDEFDDFIEKNGHEVLIAHSPHKLHCDCWNPTTKEGDSNCPECFGTGWNYRWFKTKTRRTERSMSSNKIDFNEEIKVYSVGYSYYFKSNIKIFADDLIFEINDGSLRNDIAKFIVTNHDLKSGKDGVGTYREALANKISINNKEMKDKVNQILKQHIDMV